MRRDCRRHQYIQNEMRCPLPFGRSAPRIHSPPDEQAATERRIDLLIAGPHTTPGARSWDVGLPGNVSFEGPKSSATKLPPLQPLRATSSPLWRFRHSKLTLHKHDNPWNPGAVADGGGGVWESIPPPKDDRSKQRRHFLRPVSPTSGDNGAGPFEANAKEGDCESHCHRRIVSPERHRRS